MIKNIFKAIGCLSLVVTAFNPVLAQENQTPASVEKLKMQNIWMNNTTNAAAGVVDASKVYSISSLGYQMDKGDFSMTQAGKDNNQFQLKTEGGGVYEKLSNMFMYGELSYTRDVIKESRFNLLEYDPFRDIPFLLADTNTSKWIRQQYDLSMKIATPQLFNFLTLGVTGNYMTGLSAKQDEPKTQKDVSRFGIGGSILMSFGKHHIGMEFNHQNRREDGYTMISNSRFTSRAWDYVAPGFFREAEMGSFSSLVTSRYNHSHLMNGALQYGFKNDHWNFLLEGKYQHLVEDINNESLDSSPYTGRKMIGTVVQDTWSGKVVLNYTFNNGNMLALNASYADKHVDGIEYFQEYNSEFEVQAWEVKAKYIRSTIDRVHTDVKLDYIVNDGNVYKWWFGANFANRTYDWAYILPSAGQNVANSIFGVHASRHIQFNDNNSLTVKLNGAYSSNGEASSTYEAPGTHPDNVGWTEFTLKDFNYLTTNYVKFGGELSYSYSGFKRNDSLSLFFTVALDHYSPDSDEFDKRTISNFKIGLAF